MCLCVSLVQFRMSDGYLFARSGEIEHIENDRLSASVLAAMYGADDFNQRLAFTECLLFAVLTDDGQFALLYDTVVEHRVVMPFGLGAYGEVQAFNYQFGLAGRVGRQCGSVPTLGCAEKFSCCNVV